jgi:3-hydroxyisobutyrate dehydrogenase
MAAAAQQLMRLHGSHGNLQRDPSTFIELYRKQEPNP